MSSVVASRWTSCARLMRSTLGVQRCHHNMTAEFISSCLPFGSAMQARFIPSPCSPRGKSQISSCRYFSNQSNNNADEDSGDDSDWDNDIEVSSFGGKHNSSADRGSDTKNEALQSVIDSGIDELKATSTLISNKKETKKPLFHKGALDGADMGPTKQQLAEANRILSVTTRCLEELHRRNKKGKTVLQIGGYSILVVHVEVNANLREATVLWALPFEILMEANESTRQELTERMQYQMTEGGGGRFLQREVHGVLSHYYPPKLKFKPADDGLLQQMLDFS